MEQYEISKEWNRAIFGNLKKSFLNERYRDFKNLGFNKFKQIKENQLTE